MAAEMATVRRGATEEVAGITASMHLQASRNAYVPLWTSPDCRIEYGSKREKSACMGGNPSIARAA